MLERIQDHTNLFKRHLLCFCDCLVIINSIKVLITWFVVIHDDKLSCLFRAFTVVLLILLIVPVTRPFSLWNLIKKEITCEWQLCVKQIQPSLIYRYKHKGNIRFTNKFPKTLIAIRYNILQVCPSVLPFVFAVSFIPSFFNYLNGYFLCFTQFGDGSHSLYR